MVIHQPKIAIIGSGFSGMTAAIQLQKKFGIRARLFEMNSDIGGTWLANTYPGCACDIPSGLYSFGFEQNPDWTTTYSSQPEIHDYMKRVAKKYNLYEQTYFNTAVVQVSWIESRHQWQVDYRRIDHIQSEYYDIIFGGVGPLRIISVPEQYKAFKGTIMHTGAWDSNVDFTGKRVAVIGNGASAVQAIPQLQKVVKHLYSYQRTPTWVAPRYQLKYPNGIKALFRWIPFLMRLQRILLYLMHEMTFPLFKKSDSYFAHFVRWWFKRDMMKRLERKGRADLAPWLIPNYALGCKRIARSENYLEALSESNVTVKMGNIIHVEDCTLTHQDGSSVDVDILVLATGFNVTGFLSDLTITGRHGTVLNDLWTGNNYPNTYKTMTIKDFPNFFLLLGPHSGLGVILMIECQVDYAIQCIKYMIRNNIKALDPTLEAQSRYVSKVKHGLKGTTWANGGCSSYYKSGDDVFAIWPGTVASFWLDMKFDHRDFTHYQ
ncbi:uncharacterized protein BX664DRAFT_342609 [Halteromyces radiatus]|uniref:uncharacterized protein n=1 Tax=Halteromyces radiatus TaxID=101107 RepID=UPI0022205A09|nr:uncharacterized protein BX664DRAFT_342609 [Halteromyces radiatus]KAI8078751.1 hypothetical protein BX664DRAFT_342609 [Halteromyces radiatus]